MGHSHTARPMDGPANMTLVVPGYVGLRQGAPGQARRRRRAWYRVLRSSLARWSFHISVRIKTGISNRPAGLAGVDWDGQLAPEGTGPSPSADCLAGLSMPGLPLSAAICLDLHSQTALHGPQPLSKFNMNHTQRSRRGLQCSTSSQEHELGSCCGPCMRLAQGGHCDPCIFSCCQLKAGLKQE